MPFITQFNASRIARQLDVEKIDLDQALFRRRIYFLSKYERAELIAFRMLVKEDEFFVSHVYTPIPIQDTGKFVFEYDGQKPSYHESPTCFLLNRDFENIEISDELKQRLKERNVSLKEFRRWAYDVLLPLFRKRDWGAIVYRIQAKFQVEVKQSDIVQFENSDIALVDNVDLDELEHKIDQLIAAAGRYYFDHPEILRSFSKLSFLHKKDGPIEGNHTGLSDKDLKAFLKDYHERFKRPLIHMLKQWYMVSFNPKLEFQGTLLEQLNFKCCSHCKEAFDGSPDVTSEESPSQDAGGSVSSALDDDLPF